MRRCIFYMIFLMFFLPVAGGAVNAVPPAEIPQEDSTRVFYGNIYGTIRAAGTGMPVAEARVRVMDHHAAAPAIREAASGADGSFLVSGIPITGISRMVTVIIEAHGLDPVTVNQAMILPGALMALQIDVSMTDTGNPHAVAGRETSEVVIVNKFRHELQKSAGIYPLPGDGERILSHHHDGAFRLTIFATRLGLVGATTANGHVIRERDHFAALPSLDVLCSRGGYEYEVRVEYEGFAETVPIWDVGPWNIHDNYWEPEYDRMIYQYLSDGGHVGGLGQGIPEAEAAYELNFNSSRDEFGRRVVDPAGIDLADGTFWDGLDMRYNDWITVEYLWLDDHDDDDESVYVNCFIHCTGSGRD